MDKKQLLNNVWVLRIVSLIFAVMLFATVQANNNAKGNFNRRVNTVVTATETISNVPVYLGEHEDNLLVTDLPKSVTVVLSGPRNLITQLSSDSFQVETESLMGIMTGKRTVKLIAKGLPDGVEYQITPSSKIVVNIAKQTQVTLPVTYEIASDAIADNYSVVGVDVYPSQVTLLGTEELINKVSKVFVRITTNQPRSSSFKDLYRLQIVDAKGNLLDLQSSNSRIEVNVEVASQTKEVPLQVEASGENIEAYTYDYLLPQQLMATIYGEAELLVNISAIKVNVDVSELRESGQIVGVLQLPEGIEANVENVPVQVTLKAKEIESRSIIESTNESATVSESETNEAHDENLSEAGSQE